MAGIDFTIGGNLGYLDTLRKKFQSTASDIRRGFSERIGQRMFDGLLVTAQAIPQIMGKAIQAAADNETALVAFKTLIGSAEKAGMVFADLKKFAAETPFEIPELNDAAKKLIAFGEDADGVVGALRRIGDVSSGIGAPIAEIADLYGKARVQGTLFAEDINQLAGRGVPIFQELGKAMGVPASQVKKLASEGKVTFPYLEQAFINMTDKGGKFAGMMEAQSQTLNGQLSSLKDNITQAGASLAESFLPAIKETAEVISQLISKGDFASFGGLMKTAFGSEAGGVIDSFLGTPVEALGKGFKRFQFLAPGIANMQAEGVSDKHSATREKFDAKTTSKEVTSREDIQSVLADMQKAEKEIANASGKFVSDMSVERPDLQRDERARLSTTVDYLKKQAAALSGLTDEQLAANKAKAEATAAEKKHAAAIADAQIKQEKLSKSLADQVEKSREKAVANLPLADQIEAAKADLAKIQREFSDVVKNRAKRGDAPEAIAAGIDKDTDPIRRGKDTEVLTRALKSKDELLDLTRKQAEEDQKVADARREAVDSYNEELSIMRAEISGSAEKLATLKREAEVRKKIAEWMKLGVPEATAKSRAGEWAKADADLVAAQERRRKDGLMQGGRDAAGDAKAVMNGTSDEREIEKKKRELMGNGLTESEADATARNESDFRKITDLQGQRDGLSAGSTVTAADSMRRIGGGGGAAGTGLDYQKQQTDLIREQNRILERIAARKVDLN